jgi:glycosyltransferase involved in cell wall biosynthesis/GT2 family glycosyltransferase
MSLYQARTPGEARSLLPAGDHPVVVVPVFNSYEDVVRCYEAYFRNTPVDVPLLVVDDRGWDRRPFQVLKEIFAGGGPEHDVVVLEQISNKGFLSTMNDAFVATGRHDVVILNSDVIVGPEWLTRMREAAYSSTTVATVTALTNHGTIVSIPTRNVATDHVPGGLSVDEAARRVAAGSPKLRPRIPTAIGHCTYVRRTALDVVGPFDPAFAPGYGEEVDFSQRAIAAGFENIVADDVYVFHKGGSSFGRSAAMDRRKLEHEQIIQNRYPYYGAWVRRTAADDYSPLAAALLAARKSVLGLVVAIDGMCLGPLPAGTQIVVVETARALAAREDVHQVVVYTPTVVPDYVRQAFAGLDKVSIEPTGDLREAAAATDKAHVVYRPYQVRDADELEWLRGIGERVVINQLDFIAYHDAAYFGGDQQWRRYRDLAKLAAFAVDGLTYLSDHSRDAARYEGLLPEDKPNKVIYCGTEHTALVPVTESRPAGLEELTPGFLLCLGVSYLHKNRMFALRVLDELYRDGWRGSLVLAGAQPPDGSSLADEARFLIEHPELVPHVVNLAMISEAEKVWLYRNTGLVLYPTISEGFGLIPFEAAHFGVPCLSTRQGSLDEVLPADIPIIASFDPAAAAATARALLDDPAAAQKVVSEILAKGAEFTWARVADDVMQVLQAVTSRPACRVAAIRGEQGSTYLTDAGLGDNGHSPLKRTVDVAVGYFVARPDLRVKLVPPGSGRQRLVRQGINALRRRL